MIKVEEVQEKKNEFKDFEKNEWVQADLEHYGRVIHWYKDTIILQARNETALVGFCTFTISCGVVHVDALLVKHDLHGKGIGSALMNKIHEIAHTRNAHKIYLETGKNWQSRRFYEKHGFSHTGDLPKHLDQHDYVIYSKFL